MSVLSKLLQLDSSAIGSNQITLEPMRRRHLTRLMPIERAAYPKSWKRSVFESELSQVARGSRHYIVAKRGRDVVGYAGLWFTPDPDGDQAHITNIAVAERARRSGVATTLLVSLARTAIARRCAAWTLEVRISSTGAQDLYRTFGFEAAGVRKNYYDNTEDAIVMWCHDIRSPEYAERLRVLAGEC